MSVIRRQRYLRILRKYASEKCDEYVAGCPCCIARKTLKDVDKLIKERVKEIQRIERDASTED